MDEQDIELLKTLIDTQNITKTAKKLYTTQSSLTKRIQKMEQDLGCQLFIRSRKGILPTPAAEGIFPEIEKISQSMEHIRAYALSLQGEICGSLKIGVAFRTKCKIFSRHLQNSVSKAEKGRFKGL